MAAAPSQARRRPFWTCQGDRPQDVSGTGVGAAKTAKTDAPPAIRARAGGRFSTGPALRHVLCGHVWGTDPRTWPEGTVGGAP
jgi:hypothetical protein